MDLPITLVAKLGSIAVHAEELTEPGAHDFDLVALRQLLADPEVAAWRIANRALFPVKRSTPQQERG